MLRFPESLHISAGKDPSHNNLIRIGGRCIQVNEADLDWLVYHRLPEGTPVPLNELAARCGLGLPDVKSSIARLERSCLVEQSGGAVRMLTFGEALIRNQLKYEEDLPFVIENGVIKEKKRDPCPEKK